MPKVLREWLQKAGRRAGSAGKGFINKEKLSQAAGRLRKRIPKRFDPKGFDVKTLAEHSGSIRWVLAIIALFLAAELASRIAGLFIRPTYPTVGKRNAPNAQPNYPADDYDAILRRNMFNVEGKIPPPFDQGLLDCMSQARPSTQRMQLQGTIVMNDEKLSVALVQEDGNALKIAVKKDDTFFDKFVAMKVERKKLCFQVKSTQEFEFIEIPDDSAGIGVSPSLSGGGDGITPVSENSFAIKKNFLNEKLGNLNEILQTARAVPNIEAGTGKFKGFLIQSIESNSPFAQLGLRQGDVLTDVNDINLDNPGKGLEAFQKLKDSPKVTLVILRGGQKTTLSYEVQQ
jgi:general secretion pathway protein C